MIFFNKRQKITVLSLVEKRIDAMKESRILFKGAPYAENTINSWKNFCKVWSCFCCEKNTDYKVKELSENDYNLFLHYCDSRGFSLTTKKLFSSLLKVILNENGGTLICTSANFIPENHIYLTEKEINAISELDLAQDTYLSKIRDIFMVGYFTGQRFSDYKELSANDIITLEYSGRRFKALRICQTKTKIRITIPILDKMVLEILERWGGKLPKVSHSGFNGGIKKLCLLAGIAQNIVIIRSKGGKVTTESIPKWKMISSHTARRSCITNLYMSGKLSEMQIRSISGHCSASSFRRYICCSEEENVCNILQRLSGDSSSSF